MWRSFLARVLIWFVALAGLGLYASAQTNAGDIYGTVVDEQGSGIPGGTATLTGPIAPRTTTVDAAGQFRFLKVPPGKYTLTVTMPGFTTVKREDVVVTLGKAANLEFKLKVSNVQESVTVSGETPLLDTRKASTGATFSRDELTDIPTARDVWSLIQQVPGVQLDQVNVAGNGSATAGGPDFTNKGSSNVQYLVDGSTVTDNSYGNPFRAPERRDQHLLRLRHVPERRGHDGRRSAGAPEPRRPDQRRDQAGHQRDQGLRPVPLRFGELAGQQHAAGGDR